VPVTVTTLVFNALSNATVMSVIVAEGD